MTVFYKAGFQLAFSELFKNAQDATVLQFEQALDRLAQMVPQRGKKYRHALETAAGMPKDPPGFGFSFPATAGFSYDTGRAGMTFVDVSDASVM